MIIYSLLFKQCYTSSNSAYDVTYEIVIRDADNNIVHLDLVEIKAGETEFIPMSVSWKDANDETSEYTVEVFPMVNFDGLIRVASEWDFSTDILPVLGALE